MTNSKSLPKGFEKKPEQGANVYKTNAPKSDTPNTVNFRGRPGGGPGRGMAQTVEHAENVGGTLKRLLQYFKKAKSLLILLLASVVFVTIAGLLAPSIQGSAIDAIKDKAWNALWICAVSLLAVYLVNVLFILAQSLLAARLSQSIVKHMRHDLFQKIDHLSIKYLDTHSNGDVMSRMTNDVENVSNTISQSLGSLVSGILTIIGTVAIMFVYCWQLTLITMVTVILTIFITKKMSKAMRKVYRKRSVILGQLNGHSAVSYTHLTRYIIPCIQKIIKIFIRIGLYKSLFL